MDKHFLNIPGIDRPLAMHLHPENDLCVSKHIREQGIWEPYETSLILDYLNTGDVFLDIGANIGYYTVLAGTTVGESGLVLAYEPDRDNFALLQENLVLNNITNARPFMAAVSDYTGQGKIYRSEDNSGDHQLYDNGEGRVSMPADVVHGGNHVGAIIDRVNFIKIDTQGSETCILNSLADVIMENRSHLAMIVELWPYGLRQAGSSAMDLLNILESFGMAFYVIDHIGHQITPVTSQLVGMWVADTDADPENEGFANLLMLPQHGMGKMP